MPLSDLTEQDYSDLAAVMREAIDAEPHRVGPHIKRLRLLLAKLESESDRAAGFPPPMPSTQPSLLYLKLRGGRRKR